MIILPNPEKLEVVLSAAGSVDTDFSWVDSTGVAGSNVTPGSSTFNRTTAGTFDLVPATGSGSIFRNIKSGFIRNVHASTSNDVTVQRNVSGASRGHHKITLKAGECLQLVEGVGYYALLLATFPCLMRCLDADATGQNIATVQPWFPTTGSVTVEALTLYRMTGELIMTRAAGVTSHTTGLIFGGTATLTGIQYQADVNTGDVETTIAAARTTSRVATNTTVKAASTSATETISISIEGIVRINAAGTFIPQFIYSAIPGGAPTIKANSYFKLDKIGPNTFTALGPWS